MRSTSNCTVSTGVRTRLRNLTAKFSTSSSISAGARKSGSRLLSRSTPAAIVVIRDLRVLKVNGLVTHHHHRRFTFAQMHVNTLGKMAYANLMPFIPGTVCEPDQVGYPCCLPHSSHAAAIFLIFPQSSRF